LLGRPCDPFELRLLIERSYRLRELTKRAEVYRETVAAGTLPSRPGVYTELNRILSDPRWEPEHVAKAIESDIAISAKVLQLANSAFFYGRHHISTVREAVMHLGADSVRSLVLAVEAFGKLSPKRDGFSIDHFHAHAMLVGRIAEAILPRGRTQQEAVTAGLLHDIGKLLLVADRSPRWLELNVEARQRWMPLHEVELERGGVTHAELGAHLLSLWGLPDGIVEAVAHHHDPGSALGLALDAVAAVHVADALAQEIEPEADEGLPPATLDERLLDSLGLRHSLDLWRHLARQIHDRDNRPAVGRR